MSLFVFNNQQKLIKSVPNRDLISVVQDQAINVSDTLFVEMPADIWSNLKEPASHLAVQDPYERFSYHMYKVSKHTTKADTTEIEAIQIGYDELKAYGYIKDRRFNNRPVLEAATAIVDGTDWQLGYVDTNLPNVNTNFYYISRLEALSKLIEATGAEVRFRIEISGNKIIAKRLDLYKKLGTFKGKRFAYGSNLLEIIKEEDTSELYTALVGRGKGEETDTGGFGRRITFADIAWSKASGKPADKPLGQEFIELPEMTAYYGYPDGEPRTGIVEFGDIEEPELLLKATYERLVETSRPQVQFKAKVQTTGDMELGEEVAIIRSNLGFRYKTRVFRVKRDYLNNIFTEVELGDKLTETLASRIKKIDTTNARREETIIQYIQTAANGKNRIFRGEVEPTEGMMVNDLWYKPVGEGEIEMYQFDGAYWQLILSTLDTTNVQQEVETALSEAEAAKQIAITGRQEAIEEAERLVEEQSEAFDTQIADVNQEINTVKTNIDTSISNVNQEITDNFTSLSDSISYVASVANQANTDAQTGITNAAAAFSQANSAIGDAQVAQQNALTALGKADNALGGVSNLDIRVDDVEAEIALKANNTFITEDGVLTTLSNAITVNANRFSSDMSRIESRVESLAGEINLVILKDAFKGQYVSQGDIYPNASGRDTSDTMQEIIDVIPGEYLALSKETVTGDNWWRINYYDLNYTYVLSRHIEGNNEIITVPLGVSKMWVSYPSGSKSQIVRGTQFVPYRPNLADQMTTDEIVLFRNEYDEFADKTVRRLTSIDSSGGRLETAELLITQTASGLALKADNTTVNTLTGRLSTAEGQISAQAGQIALRVTEVQAKNIADSAVDGIEVGGRNLLANSGEIITNGTYNIASYDLTIPPSQGDLMTVTIKGKLASTKTGFVVYNSGGGVVLVALESIGGGLYTQTFNWNIGSSSNTYLNVYAFTNAQVGESTIEWIKLEKGNKATDWTPAPEDAVELISSVSSELKIEKDNITALLTRTGNNETAITAVKTTADGTKTTVSNHAGRLTTVETNVNGLQVSVADKVSNAQFTVLSNSVSSVVSDLNNLEIGGRNLLLDSEEIMFLGGARTTHMGKSAVALNAPFSGVYTEPIERYSEDVVSGETYTISFLTSYTGTKGNSLRLYAGDGLFLYQEVSNYELVEGGKYIRVYVTAKATQNMIPRLHLIYNGTGVLYVTDFKTEKGNKATDWTPAPEDMATQSQITQLSNQINLRVAKGDVVSQINIEADRTLISTGKLVLDANTYIMGTTFVNDLKAKSIEAVTANIATIRSQVLTADVVTSVHIKSDTALIDKLFTTNANINTLTSKVAFINNIKSISISADKITAGTLDAADVNIINLNVSKLVGDTSNFVQSAWNGINTNLTINSSGLTSNSSNGTQYRLGATGVEYIADGVSRGVIKAYNSGDGPYEGAARGVAAYAYRGNEFHIGYQGYPVTGTYIPAITVHGTTGDISLLSDNIRLSVPTIYPNKSSNDNFTVNYMSSGGVSIRNGATSGAGLYLYNSGAVQRVGTGNFVPGVMSSAVSRVDGLQITRTTISGVGGYLFSHSNANKAGIIFADNGYVYIKSTEGTYSVVKPNFGT